ncbi:Anthranilate synthase component 1 [Gammaproteobacteria bacterium]
MKLDQFLALATQGYTHIPVLREVLADLETPLSTYLKLARGPYSYLLESVQGGEKWGRYSIIGLPCRTVIRVIGHEIRLEHDGIVTEQAKVADPLAWIGTFQSRYRVPSVSGQPRFTGGLVGYFGYDTVRYIEPRLDEAGANLTGPRGISKPDPIGTPDILLMLSDEVVVFDNLKGKLYLVVHAKLPPATLNGSGNERVRESYIAAENRLDELETLLCQPLSPQQRQHDVNPVREEDFHSDFTRTGFEEAVSRSKRYIVDGDIMQVVLSQRLSIPFRNPPLDLYRALRCVNPSPYLYFFDLDAFHIVGSSPEILTRLQDQIVTVRPIAGTRPRGATEEIDQALEQELLADPKERAEHLMLIDLGRNDVGRVSTVGSVQLTEKMVIERYSHVMHIVSNVTGHLRDGLTALDALRATFPAGTVSGAAKVRSMEIIEELEPVKRGIYAGAVGYIGWSGNMDTAITIRTAVIKDSTLHIQVGAGIVYDSVPAKEWDETMNKGRAMFRAVAMVQEGFKGCG